MEVLPHCFVCLLLLQSPRGSLPARVLTKPSVWDKLVGMGNVSASSKGVTPSIRVESLKLQRPMRFALPAWMLALSKPSGAPTGFPVLCNAWWAVESIHSLAWKCLPLQVIGSALPPRFIIRAWFKTQPFLLDVMRLVPLTHRQTTVIGTAFLLYFVVSHNIIGEHLYHGDSKSAGW